MLQLDEAIINEYSAVIEENKATIEEKEKLLKMVASALQSVTEEKDKQEQELKSCNERVMLIMLFLIISYMLMKLTQV